jgi:CheY-like chemotaxis protein
MTLRILVVDDTRENVLLLRTMLERRGIEVDYAYDGASALQLLDQHRFDVMLLDIMMPNMDGLEVLDRVRSNPQLATLPVILVTAKAQDSDLLDGYRGGADYYITKPFTTQQVLYGVGLVLGRDLSAEPTRAPLKATR